VLGLIVGSPPLDFSLGIVSPFVLCLHNQRLYKPGTPATFALASWIQTTLADSSQKYVTVDAAVFLVGLLTAARSQLQSLMQTTRTSATLQSQTNLRQPWSVYATCIKLSNATELASIYLFMLGALE